VESALRIAKIVEERRQILTLNLAAPFITQVFGDQLDQILPYADFVIGNESEALAWTATRQKPVSISGAVWLVYSAD
jgi:adenosine kinase